MIIFIIIIISTIIIIIISIIIIVINIITLDYHVVIFVAVTTIINEAILRGSAKLPSGEHLIRMFKAILC